MLNRKTVAVIYSILAKMVKEGRLDKKVYFAIGSEVTKLLSVVHPSITEESTKTYLSKLLER